MKSKRDVRVIPKSKGPMQVFLQHASKRGWLLEKAIARTPKSKESGEVVLRDLPSQTIVTLRDDALAGFRFFIVCGRLQTKIAEEIRGVVPSYSDSELLQWWDGAVASNDIDDKVDAVLYLGTGSPPEPRKNVSDRLLAALDDNDDDVRNAAIVGAGFTDWADVFRDKLTEMAKKDSNATARKRARVVLDRWDK
jgi:hypothetical protein